ncbi:hypothetical protein ACJMK2_001244 [Sinanodonta woodiana]|uniref:SWIM-type domain-containing protein n=1 Tax=Sinanodonta woodiana TaxID=1069815 RepID=A0ABD3XRN7_SINWO
MKQQFYRVILMLNAVGDIIHASCSCPDGSGPSCTCKHTAALCYALEDFVKVFVLPEDIPSCTENISFSFACYLKFWKWKWNKPRQVKLPAVPVYDIDFTRKKSMGKKKTEPTIKRRTTGGL